MLLVLFVDCKYNANKKYGRIKNNWVHIFEQVLCDISTAARSASQQSRSRNVLGETISNPGMFKHSCSGFVI